MGTSNCTANQLLSKSLNPGLGVRALNPRVNKRDLSTGENGEKYAKRAVTRARGLPSAGSPVNGDAPKNLRNVGDNGADLRKRCCQQIRPRIPYWMFVAPQKYGFPTFSPLVTH